MIDARAIIDPGAVLADDVSIGPYSVIGAGVEIGPGCVIGPHVVIKGPTRIGRNNRIYQFASIGDDPRTRNTAANPRASRSATTTRSGNIAPSTAARFRTRA